MTEDRPQINRVIELLEEALEAARRDAGIHEVQQAQFWGLLNRLADQHSADQCGADQHSDERADRVANGEESVA